MSSAHSTAPSLGGMEGSETSIAPVEDDCPWGGERSASSSSSLEKKIVRMLADYHYYATWSNITPTTTIAKAERERTVNGCYPKEGYCAVDVSDTAEKDAPGSMIS